MRNNLNSFLSALALVLFCAPQVGLAADAARVVSPDEAIQFKAFLHEGRLTYAVSFKKQPVVEASPLSFSVDGVALTEGATFGDVKTYRVKETYAWRGVHSRAVNHCNGATIALKHARSKTGFTLEVRAFNDGVAFRTVVPGDKAARVPDEATRFLLPVGSTVWYHDLNGHYEGVHKKKAIADVPEGDWAAPPLTFKVPRGLGYASLTEAALVNYSGMALQADGRRGFRLVLGHKHPVSYPFKLRYRKADIERLSRPAAVTGTIASPWRVVLISADLNALVNADVIPNLCPPPDARLFPKGIRTEWVKSGRAVWKYLDGGASTLAGMKEFCKLAGELGFEYCVVEGFWRRWSDAQLKELVKYGRDHRVGIWLWKHCKELREPRARGAFFKKCHELGVAGVKIDFFDHEAKEVIDFYQALLKEAAENRLLVNFHGSNKPTGEPRTWPNELVREAVRGMEASRLKARARHNTTLPFTRYLAGHADYTPVHFGARRGDTTVAHQVASAAVFTAPLLTYAAHPQKMLANPCAPMLKSIPASWDETVVLSVSEIGEIAAFARRSGDKWFLAVINGPDARTIRVPLKFLGTEKYNALLIRDRKDDPAAVRVEETAVLRGDTLTISMSACGGFIARFSAK
jgi:alpha-glucosidase